MKNIKISAMLFITVLYMACQPNCENKEFQIQFYYHLAILEELSRQDSLPPRIDNTIDLSDLSRTFDVSELQDAGFFMMAVTKIGCEGYNPEWGIYIREGELAINIEKWKKWYEDNKCVMTKQKADSLVSLFGYPCK